MNVEIKVPEMGESVIDATIARWIKQPGEAVQAGEALVELETDKINLEVTATQAGVLQETKPVGTVVGVGEVLGVISAQQTGDRAESESQPKAEAKNPPPAASTPVPGPSPDTSALDGEAVRQDGAAQPLSAVATPVAQRMAQDLGVDLRMVTPSGSGGRITKEDVQAFAQKGQGQAAQPTPAVRTEQPPAQVQSTQASPDARGPVTRIRMTRRRQTIAQRLVEAQHTAAMLTTFNEVDMSAVINLRKRRRESFKEQYGVDLGFMSFFVKASVGALKAFPNVNAEIQGAEIVQKGYYDIGIAVGAEEGLVVPVLRGAERMSFAEIENQIRAFVDKAKNNSFALEDLRGGTFTITNGGVFGSLLSTPILNPPQVGILGMHRIQERPVVINGEIVARPMMYVALSYDHRIVDGREAVQFLVRLKELVEDPEALLFA